jgi:hypothetical protein
VNKAKKRRERKEAINQYVSGVGKVCYAWNNLVETLGYIFVDVTGINFEVAQAIWYSVDYSDRTQMKMLMAAIEATPKTRWEPGLPHAHRDLSWLVKKAVDLADSRNNVVHAPCVIQYKNNEVRVVSHPDSGHSRAKSLAGKMLEDEFEYCTERATLLESFAEMALLTLRHEHSTWPNRPALPERKQTKRQPK